MQRYVYLLTYIFISLELLWTIRTCFGCSGNLYIFKIASDYLMFIFIVSTVIYNAIRTGWEIKFKDQEEGACLPHFCSAIYNIKLWTSHQKIPRSIMSNMFAARPLGGSIVEFHIIIRITLLSVLIWYNQLWIVSLK